jgi:NAD(P)-dependent dehydrogenase (short-subunit alcohol dehydrogenase family)
LELTRELSKSWAKFNIRVNAIAPGYTNTELAIVLSVGLLVEEILMCS